MKLQDINPKYAQRGIWVGKTGSGKSYLWKVLLCQTDYNDIVIIDPKDEIFIKGSLRVTSPDDLPEGDFHGIIIYCPDPDFDNVSDYDRLLRWVYARKNTLLVIDEIYALGKDNAYPNTLRTLYTRGRSIGISVWGCSQRPTWIPLFCISEVDHQFCFRLKLNEDRNRMAQVMGDPVKTVAKGHEFWYCNDEIDTPVKLVYDENKKELIPCP